MFCSLDVAREDVITSWSFHVSFHPSRLLIICDHTIYSMAPTTCYLSGFFCSPRSILNFKTPCLCYYYPWCVIMIVHVHCFLVYLALLLSSKTILFIVISRNQYSNYFEISMKKLSVTKMIFISLTEKKSIFLSSLLASGLLLDR